MVIFLFQVMLPPGAQHSDEKGAKEIILDDDECPLQIFREWPGDRGKGRAVCLLKNPSVMCTWCLRCLVLRGCRDVCVAGLLMAVCPAVSKSFLDLLDGSQVVPLFRGPNWLGSRVHLWDKLSRSSQRAMPWGSWLKHTSASGRLSWGQQGPLTVLTRWPGWIWQICCNRGTNLPP